LVFSSKKGEQHKEKIWCWFQKILVRVLEKFGCCKGHQKHHHQKETTRTITGLLLGASRAFWKHL
jgi:hypothetical protein